MNQSKVTSFYQSYDGTEMQGPTSIMPFWPTKDIDVGDLVLIEVQVARFQPNERGADVRVNDGTWSTYVVELELLAVCMLSKGNGGELFAELMEQ